MKRLGLLLLLSTAAFAQNSRYDNIASGARGPIPNATVAVCTQPANTVSTPCTPIATLCSSFTDVICNQPNPFQADLLGNFHFYAPSALAPYTIQIYGPQVATPYVMQDQLLAVGGQAPAPVNTLPNCTAAGTVQNEGVQFSTQVVNSVTQLCGTLASASSNNVVAICVSSCGNSGSANVVYNGYANGIFDGTTIQGDYAIPSATPGQFTDIGSVKPSGTVEVFGVIASTNTGAGTASSILVSPLSLFAAGSSLNSGNINNAAQFKLPYYSSSGSSNVLSGDVCTTDGSGNATCHTLATNGVGTGTVTYGTGPAPSTPSSGNATTYVDSTTNQFTCLLSTGGVCTPASVYQALSNGFKCDGSTADTTALTNLITTIGSQQAVIQFPLGKKCVIGNATVPTNVELDFSPGAAFQMVTSTTLTIKGGVNNPDNHQIFFSANSGTTGTIDFTGNPVLTTLYPEWWGAVASGGTATANTVAIQNAVYGAFGCGPVIACRSNASGNYKWNKILKLLGNYQTNAQINLYHVISFTVSCNARNHAGITQTASNTQIFDGQSVAYGVFDGCSWATTASQDLSHPLISLDYSSAQGVDIATQFVDFNSNNWSGGSGAKLGFQLSRSGGGAQGSNIHFYNNESIGFTEAAYMIGAGSAGTPTQVATNAIDIQWLGGDVQTCPTYGIENFGGGSLVIEGTTFEDGFTAQTGYDVWSGSVPAGEWATINNVRSESRRLFGSDSDLAVNNSFVNDQSTAFTPGNSPVVGTILEGSNFGGDGVFYKISVQGALGGLATVGSPRTASAGSATTITDSVGGLTVNAYTGYQVTLVGGSGAYQYCVVTSNTASVFTCTAGWVTRTAFAIQAGHRIPIVITNPDNTTSFIVEPNWGTQFTSGAATWTSMGEKWSEGYLLANNIFVPGEQLTMDFRSKVVNGKFTRTDWADSGVATDAYGPASISHYQNILVVDQNNSSMAYRNWSLPHPDAFTGITNYSSDFKGAVPVCWGDGTASPANTKDDICMGINGTGILTINNNSSGTPQTLTMDSGANLKDTNVIASTAGSAIAAGSGSTHANSSVSAAGTSPLTMTLNINVGDFVIIFTNTSDVNPVVTDNGGNTYVRLGLPGSIFGNETMWYVQSATAVATTITVTDASVFTISGATYVHVTGVGVPIIPKTANSNSMTMSVTTVGPNSLVVGAFTFSASPTFTPTSGSTVTSSFNNTNTVNIGMLQITAATTGSYTLSATATMGTPTYDGIMVELQSTANQNSPSITLAGTAWNGASSTAQLGTLQLVVPAVPSPAPYMALTPGLSVANQGVFSTTVSSGPYLQASVNQINANQEYTLIGQPGTETTAVFGGVSVPTASTIHQVNGLYGSVNSYSTTTSVVGGYLQGRALANSAIVFGSNSIASDMGFTIGQLFGQETDINVSSGDANNPTSKSQGIRIISGGTKRPASGIYIAGATGNTNFLSGLTIDMANSGDTNPTRMIYLIPPDNLQSTTSFQLRNHTNAADVLTMTDAGGVKPSTYLSQTNCAASGTAANPSVASCSAAPAGSFACATAASTGTCQVNTTAVTAASEIFITQRTDTTTGTTLSVTCNTGVSTVIPVVTAVTAATSFTINLGTFNTNPECFSYFIVN